MGGKSTEQLIDLEEVETTSAAVAVAAAVDSIVAVEAVVGIAAVEVAGIAVEVVVGSAAAVGRRDIAHFEVDNFAAAVVVEDIQHHCCCCCNIADYTTYL